MKFGCLLPLELSDFEGLAQIANECERLGYDSLWAYDHLSPFWTQSGRALECWTVLAALAERTERIKIGSLVTNVNLRNPALLAKMASTVDVISGGRLVLGLGTGDRLSRNELTSFGYRFAELDERVARLKETILILKAMWTRDEASFEGEYYKLSHAANLPKPKQSPHPPIWVGGKHRKILDVVAELADGWNYWGLGKETLSQLSRYLSARCVDFGRDPERIVKSWSGTFSHIFRTAKNHSAMVDNIVSQLRSQADMNTEYFIASFGPKAKHESYKAFAEAVTKMG
jgi:alkanesulfonate monooxygenase SsuD/methylene tetrahydromethanopterin reductase-like flavin-dependent oxidoreductase (luciferase family)